MEDGDLVVRAQIISHVKETSLETRVHVYRQMRVSPNGFVCSLLGEDIFPIFLQFFQLFRQISGSTGGRLYLTPTMPQSTQRVPG